MDEILPQQQNRVRNAIRWTIFGVISVMILFSLLFPPITCGPGPQGAPRAAAKNDVVQIANAISAYYTEYNIPLNGTHEEIIQVLVGNDARKNSLKIVFLDAPVYKPPGWFAKAGRSGIKDGIYLDPWGNPYQIEERYPDKPHVSSPGPNKKYKQDESASDDILSWK